MNPRWAGGSTGRRRTRVLAVGVAVTTLAVVLAGCGQSATPSPTVSLLPKAGATPTGWTWTASCPFAPARGGACAGAAPDLGHAQLSGDEWNLGTGGTGQGSVDMSVGPTGVLDIRGDLRTAPPCTASGCIASSANTWVRGYPSVLYGINQCHPATSPPRSPGLDLPERVTAVAGLIGTTRYVARPASSTFDIAYDLWLNRSASTTCKEDGTVEVMVWTDYDRRALLPPSLLVGTATIPYRVDGSVRPGTDDWSVYASNIGRDGQTVPWGGTVWLVPRASSTVAAGSVGVDLGAALSSVGILLRRVYGWTDFDRTYWLDTVAFGTEYGPAGRAVAASGPTAFALHLAAFCLDLHTSLTRAVC
jgi:hypothetical protein